MYQAPLCKNDRCSSLVPPSKNPGRPALFCSRRCGRKYHSRMAYEREIGGGLGIKLHDGVAWFNRIIARSVKAARERLDLHNGDCPFSASGGTCPARWDTYDRKKLCLIRAVLNEDWAQLMAAEEGRAFERELTTIDGHWLSDVPESDHVKETRSSMGTLTLTPAEREALIAAGAATPS